MNARMNATDCHVVEPAPLYPCALDRAGVEAVIPHRGEILFVRSATLHSDCHYSGVAHWAAGTIGLAGHFPAFCVVPAVFIIEAVAQLAGVGLLVAESDLGNDSGGVERIGMLASTRRCVFSRAVLPGEDVTLEVHARELGDGFAQVKGTAHTAQGLAATVELLVAHVPVEKLAERMNEVATPAAPARDASALLPA